MGKWLASTWEASILKIAVAAGLGALASWLATSQVHPLIVAVAAATIPVIVNYLNGSDPRYGIGAQPHYTDVSTSHEIEVEGED